MREKIKKIKGRSVVKIAPLTSEQQLKKTITERNAKNRARSKAMEHRIAQILRGRRVPMSGAAAKYKGDVEIPFVNYPGAYIIECKLSAQRNVLDEPKMPIDFAWFPKIQIEARNMNAKFGVLIIHFHGNNNDYVFVRKDVLEKIIYKYETPYADILLRAFDIKNVFDIRYLSNGKPRLRYDLTRNDIENRMIDLGGIYCARFILPDDEYFIVNLTTFRDILAHT